MYDYAIQTKAHPTMKHIHTVHSFYLHWSFFYVASEARLVA